MWWPKTNPLSFRSGSTSPYVFPTDNSDTESLHWSHDDTAEWLPQLSPCPSSSSSCPSPRRSSRPAHFSSRPPRRNKRKVTTDSEMEPELYLSRTDLADSLIWPQIQEEVRTFVAKVRQKHPRAKSKDPPIIESEPHPPEIPAGKAFLAFKEMKFWGTVKFSWNLCPQTIEHKKKIQNKDSIENLE